MQILIFGDLRAGFSIENNGQNFHFISLNGDLKFIFKIGFYAPSNVIILIDLFLVVLKPKNVVKLWKLGENSG